MIRIRLKHLYVFIAITFALHSSSNSFAQVESFIIPTPSGKYAVGTTKFYLQDVNRDEAFSPDESDFREFMVRAWYPADAGEGIEVLRYLEHYHLDSLKKVWNGFGVPDELFDLIGSVYTSSAVDAPISTGKDKYPVLIFSHGYGLGLPELYTVLMEHLASNGYIVYSLTHPYETAEIILPDGSAEFVSNRANKMLEENGTQWEKMHRVKDGNAQKQIVSEILANSPTASESLDAWVKDSQLLLDELTGLKVSTIPPMLSEKSDMEKIGVFGHSFGGATAGELCLIDNRVKAGINLDGFQYGDLISSKLSVPFMMIYSKFNDNMNAQILKVSNAPLYIVHLDNTMHFIFSDMPLYPEVFDKQSFTGTFDDESPVKFIDVQNALVLDFFNRFLLGEPEAFPE